jgi:hypothetical protein
VTRRLAVLLVLTVSLSGCQLYWRKPGTDFAAFTADHGACLKTAGAPPGEKIVLVNLDMYRACLKAKGWQRETGSTVSNPPGYYRGLENPGPVTLDHVPQQIPTSTPP